jgi:CDP-glucose 4,6-dehydratase
MGLADAALEGVVNNMQRYFKNKRVLITGHRGFLGAHLAQRLLSCGALVWGIDIKGPRSATFLTSGDLKKMRSIHGNVKNYPLVANTIAKNEIEYVFHLAAEALVGACFDKPKECFESNIAGTWNVLEAARKSAVKAVVIASSDKAYGESRTLPYTEKTPLCGVHPYDVSKSCADLLAYTYFNTYCLPVCITRCGNIYGPGDFSVSRIVPDTLRSLLTGKRLVLRSTGRYVRDYVYVDDIIDGYLLLAAAMTKSKKIHGEAFNFSNQRPISVLTLVKKSYELCGKKPHYKILGQARYEIHDQYLSSKKARRLLKWKPVFSLDKGLARTIEWYERYYR